VAHQNLKHNAQLHINTKIEVSREKMQKSVVECFVYNPPIGTLDLAALDDNTVD